MYIGFSAYNHESSAALIDKDGNLLNYYREEFLTRIKGDKSFPRKSIEKILKENQLEIRDVTSIVFYERPLTAFLYPLKIAALNIPKSLSLLSNQFRNFKKSSLSCFLDLTKTFPGLESKLLYADHHLCHTLSGLFYSEEKNNICSVVVDGFGDRSSSSIHLISDSSNIKELWNSQYPVSIGLFYSSLTDFLGFAINEGEYKVMGLAAFGNPKSKYAKLISNLMSWDEENKCLTARMEYFDYHVSTNNSFSEKMVSLLGKPRNPFEKLLPDNPNFQKYADIARGAQELTEQLLIQIFNHAHKITGSNIFCFSGGVALNSASLKKIGSLPFVEKLIIPPSPGDSGAAIGASYFGLLKNQPRKDILKKPSLFPCLVNFEEQIKITSKILAKDFNIISQNKNESLNICSDLLSQGMVIGSVISNAETGPRALGHRSLLCDGKNIEAVEILNTVIKNRSPFRPTAPAMKFETAKKYYQLIPALYESYKSMSSTCQCLPNSLALNFPITHVDGTARIQIVEEPSFLFELLNHLETHNIEIIANSSLNISGDPTCFDFIDGLMVCYNTPLKYLITDFGLVEKKN